MRVLCIDPGGFALDFMIRCRDAGHEVKHFIRDTPRTLNIGKGLLPVVREWQPWARWANLIILTDNTRYLQQMDVFRRDNPTTAVIGASMETADWELQRVVGMKMLEKNGIPVPDYKEFNDYDAAIAYVKKHERRFVSKPCGDEPDKSLSYVSKSPADMVYMLLRWKKAQKHKGPFILQEVVTGIEMAVGGWFGPGGFNEGWTDNFEFKKLMPGDLGVATGEQGTVVHITKSSKLAKLVLEPCAEALDRAGYVGYVDVNCIIGDDGTPWPLEWTMRPGWPTFQIQQQLLKPGTDPAEWLVKLAEGQDAQNWQLDRTAVGVVMSIPDYPYSHITRKEVTGIPVYGLTPAIREKVALCEVMMGSAPQDVGGKIVEAPCIVSAGDYILVATGLGDTVRAAKLGALRTLKAIEMPNSPMYRNDIGDRLKKQLPQLHEHHFAMKVAYS